MARTIVHKHATQHRKKYPYYYSRKIFGKAEVPAAVKFLIQLGFKPGLAYWSLVMTAIASAGISVFLLVNFS